MPVVEGSCLCAAVRVIVARRPGPHARMGVNARLLDHAVIAQVPVRVLDGDQTWRVLERYTVPGALISPHRAP